MKYFFQLLSQDSGEYCLLILKDKDEKTKGTWRKSAKPQDGSLRIGATQGTWRYRYDTELLAFHKAGMKSPVVVLSDVQEYIFYGVIEGLSGLEGWGSILLPDSYTEKERIDWRLRDITT